MRNNKPWLLLITLIALAVLWFTWGAAEKLWYYSRLDKHAPAEILSTKAEHLSGDRYALKAHYRFISEGHPYEGDTLLDAAIYRNPWAAEQAPVPQTAWYSGGDPTFSTLQNPFPLKALLYAATMWAILLYFIWLGAYVSRKHNGRA